LKSNFLAILLNINLLILCSSIDASAQDNVVNDFLTAEEQVWIAQHSVVTASSNTSYAPIDFMSAGHPVGLSIDYVKLLVSKVGLKVEFVNYGTWSKMLEMAKAEELDIVHTLSENEEWAEYFNFSDSYIKIPVALYGQVGSQRINSIKDLENKRIGVIKNHFVTVAYRKKHPNLKYVEFNSNTQVLRALSSGEIDIYPGDIAAIKFNIDQNNIQRLEIIGTDPVMGIEGIDQQIAVSKNNPILMSILNKAMASVSKEEFKEITQKWLKDSQVHNDIGLTDEERKWISEHPVLRATNEMEWAPLDFVLGGNPTGFSIDYLNLVAKKIGFKVEYVNGLPWNELLDLLRDKQIDISQSIIESPQRSEYLNFTKSYLDLPWVYFGREGSETINSLNDLEGRKIGIVIGSVPWDIYKKDYSYLNLIEYSSSIQAFKALSTGGIDVYAEVLPVGNYIIKQNIINGLEVIGNRFFPQTNNEDRIRLAARKDWPILISILEKGMGSITAEEFSDLTDKWSAIINNNSNIKLTPEEKQWLSENNVIKVAAEKNTFPYEFVDVSGNVSGIAGDYLKEISERLNVEFVWAGNDSWEDGLLGVQSHEIAMVATITPSKSREEFFKFTEFYSYAPQAIFSNKEKKLFSTLESLNGHQMAQVEGSIQIELLRKDYPDINIIPVDSYEEAVEFLETGKVDAFLGDIETINYLTAMSNFQHLSVSGVSPYKISNSMGIRKDLTFLASSVQKALADIEPLRRQEILKKWRTINILPPVNYTLFWVSIGIGAAILVIILVWNHSLRQEVQRRKIVEVELNKSEKRWQSILENSTSGIFLINRTGKISSVNKAGELMFGYDKNELIGNNVSMLMNKQDQLNHDAYLRNYEKNQVAKIIGIGRQLSGRHKGGTEFPIHLGIGEIKDETGEPTFIGSIADISEMKLAEENLTKAQEELKLALEESQAASEAKSDFLAAMSHDLRTPLNAIIGFSEAMKLEYFGPVNNQKYSEYICDIHSSGEYLLQLVNDTLDISALEAGKRILNFECVDIFPIIFECKTILHKMVEDKKIDLTIDISKDSTSIYADRQALKQIIMNLLSNAIKFTPSNGRVSIVEEVIGRNLAFKVADTGRGISKENIKTITEPFKKDTQSALLAHEEGTGLGLAIVKFLVELHGGQMNIKSKVDEGTSVTILLPLRSIN
tara:strand:- start:444 stop:3986 length:3543 start_codon:yes stop_codon:yes gene_type:complete